MSPEITHYAMDGGVRKSADGEFPYVTDKDAIIPREYFDVQLHGIDDIRSHTVYLDPAYEVEYNIPYEHGPRIRVNTMYEADITIRASYAYGESAHQRACAAARERVGNDSSARYYEEYLREMHNDRGIRLAHLVAMREPVGGPFLLFGYVTPNVPEYYK
jgi:hypothetical protein